ncbi:aldo/keto reductase [candidate division KSB1 bacterium]
MRDDKDPGKITRRNFLKTGSIGIAALTPGMLVNRPRQNTQTQLKTVTLGRTGVKVANIGYGSSRGNLDPSVINYAINKGITYFDTSEGYGRGQTEINLGKAIRKRRNEVFITTKVGSVNAAGRLTKDSTKEEIRDRVMASLRRLDTPYIDALFIHGAGDPDFGGFDNPNLDAVYRELKSDGKIRFFGLSTHNYNLVDTVRHAVESNKVDVMLLAYNYFQQRGAPKDWLKEFNEVVKLAHTKNIGITTMKTLQGAQGAEVLRQGIGQTDAKLAAAKWSLNNPNVDVAVISLSSIKEIDAFAGISGSPPDTKDMAILERLSRERSHTVCRIGCPAPCLRVCLHNVAIPDILRMNMYFTDYGWEKEAMLEYKTLDEARNGNSCLNCSSNNCSKSCVYGISVRQMITEACRNLTLC